MQEKLEKIFKPIARSKSRLQQRQMECTCKKPWNVLLEQKPTRQFQFLSFFLFVLLESLLSFLILQFWNFKLKLWQDHSVLE